MAQSALISQQVWQHCFEAGNNYLREGNLKNAAIAFSDAFDASGSTEAQSTVLYARAFVSWTGGRYANAVVDLVKAIKLRPGFGEAHNLLGVCLARTEQQENAVDCFTRAIELGVSNAYLNRAKTFIDLGLIQFALTDLEEAIRRDEHQYTVLDKLITTLTQQLEIKRTAILYASRALTLHYSGRCTEAAADLQYAHSLAQTQQQQAVVHSHAAQMKIQSGDYVGAIAECVKAVQLDPYCVAALYCAGRAYTALGHTREAYNTFEYCRATLADQSFVGCTYLQKSCTDKVSQVSLQLGCDTAGTAV